jgi:hypothetical protein
VLATCVWGGGSAPPTDSPSTLLVPLPSHSACCCRSDSHMKSTFTAIRCIMMDLWDHAQGECAAITKAEGQLELHKVGVWCLVGVFGGATAVQLWGTAVVLVWLVPPVQTHPQAHKTHTHTKHTG